LTIRKKYKNAITMPINIAKRIFGSKITLIIILLNKF